MTTPYERKNIEDYIVNTFRENRKPPFNKKQKKVFVESGSLNDEIFDYELVIHESNTRTERTVEFRTTGCVFPKTLKLANYDNIDYEEFEGNLFVKVW